MRRGTRITQLSVVRRAHAADEDLQVAFLVGHAHARHQGLDVAQLIVDAQRTRIVRGNCLGGTCIFLQVLFPTFDSDDDGVQR